MPALSAELTARLDDLEKNQREIIGHLKEMNGTLRDAVVEIGGVPDAVGRDPNRLSIRGRLNQLERGKDAAMAANAALGLLFGRATKAILLTGTVLAAVFSVLKFFGVGG